MKNFITKHPIIVMLILFAITQAGVKFCVGRSVWEHISVRWILGLIMFWVMYVVAGKDIFKWTKKSGRFAFKKSIYLLALPILAFILTIGLGALVGEIEIAENWLSLSIEYLVFALVVGFLEEGLFRGIVTNGFVKIMPKTKAGLYWAVVGSGLFFGFIHVWESVFDIGKNPLAVVSQMTSKTLTTGAVGMLLAAIYLKTKNIWVCMILHALNDLFLFLIFAFMGMEFLGIQYVDEVATMSLADVSLEIIKALVVSLPNIIISLRIVKRLEPAECVIWK